jgi:hypothetical protein
MTNRHKPIFCALLHSLSTSVVAITSVAELTAVLNQEPQELQLAEAVMQARNLYREEDTDRTIKKHEITVHLWPEETKRSDWAKLNAAFPASLSNGLAVSRRFELRESDGMDLPI